jgi:hypothetical protein
LARLVIAQIDALKDVEDGWFEVDGDESSAVQSVQGTVEKKNEEVMNQKMKKWRSIPAA